MKDQQNMLLQLSIYKNFAKVNCLMLELEIHFWPYLVEDGGYLILSFQCNEENYHEDIHTHPYAGFGKGGNYIIQVYSRNVIIAWIQNSTFIIVDQEFYKVFTGEFWSFSPGIVLVEKVENRDMHDLTCILLLKERILI